MHISGTPYATGCASISVPTYPPWTDIQRFPRKCIRAPSFTRRKVLWDGRRSSVIPCMKYQNPSLLLLLLHIRIDLTVTIRNNGFCLRIYISSRCDLSGGGGFLGRNCWWLVIYLSSVCERRWRAVCVDYMVPFLQRWHGAPMNLAHASHACVQAERRRRGRPTIAGVSVQWQIVARVDTNSSRADTNKSNFTAGTL